MSNLKAQGPTLPVWIKSVENLVKPPHIRIIYILLINFRFIILDILLELIVPDEFLP